MGRSVLKTLAVLCMLAIAGGCSKFEGENLLENGDFTLWNGSASMPAGWSVEGNNITVEKSDVVVDETGMTSIVVRYSSDGFAFGSPFLFQSIKDIKDLRGREIVLGAWVKTSTPDAVAIEYSDRAGIDVRSDFHPGDGKWRRLTLKYLLPDRAISAEYRLRFYAPAEALVGNVSLRRNSWLP